MKIDDDHYDDDVTQPVAVLASTDDD